MVLDKKIDVREKPNKSKTYLLPLLLKDFKVTPNILNNLINTYLSDSESLHKNCIYLLFKFDGSLEFTKFEQSIFENKNFVESYDLNDKVVYVFKYPELYTTEYDNFKKGKYSKFGEDSKIIIIKTLTKYYGSSPNVIPIIKKVKQILTKADSLREKMEKELNTYIPIENELGEMADLDKEMFNFNLYKNDRKLG